LGLWSFISGLSENVKGWFNSRYEGKSHETKREQKKRMDMLYPEYAKMPFTKPVKENKRNRFTPKPEGMKPFLRNPNPIKEEKNVKI